MRCPRKWRWAYQMGLAPVETNENLALGSAVHQVLQRHYAGGDWEVECYDAIIAGQQMKEFPDFDLKLFEAMCEGYFEWLATEGADAYLEPVLVEEQVEKDLGIIEGQHVILHGTIDLLMGDPDGGLSLFDHKTTASFEQLANRRMQLSFQLQTYAMLVEERLGQYPYQAMYNMLRKVKRTGTAKPPFFLREPVSFNAHQREAFERQLRLVVRDMLRTEQEEEVYPKVDQDCSWKCPFLAVCAMADDGSDIEGALTTLYVRSDRA